MQSQGLPGEQIQRLCVISTATSYHYLEEYRTGGLAQRKALTVSSRQHARHEYRGMLGSLLSWRTRPQPSPKPTRRSPS